MSALTPPQTNDRLDQITLARQAVLVQQASASALVPPWLNRSWQRCLARGDDPRKRLVFDSVHASAIACALEVNRPLLEAARPVIASLAKAVADTNYFALLTDAKGIVIDANGPVDRQGDRAKALARVGVDLSEQAVGTTAIGTALAERQPVWLHRGEHFYDDTAAYSCAGAPVMDPTGQCAGMLDLTGIDVPERPGLRHLVALSAKRIENAMVLSRPHRLLLRINWPGQTIGSDADGLLAIDAAGRVTGFNPAAADILGLMPGQPAQALDELFATSVGHLFDQATHRLPVKEWPLWSGLRLQVLTTLAGDNTHRWTPGAGALPTNRTRLKDVETDLIKQAVDSHRGNVAAAAKALGISRATVYRKIGHKT